MNTKKLLWAALSMTAVLMMTACSSDDNEMTEAPVAPSTTKTIPYTVTVGGDEATTRAHLEDDHKTITFEWTDKLYITGENIQGVLDITERSTNTATFSGELTYSGEGSPADDLPLTATLVSYEQEEGGTLISVDAAGAVTVNYPTAAYSSNLDDAVKEYSWLTGTSTYGARAFTLKQQTAFLNFEITFGIGTTAGTIPAVVSNNGSTVCTANVTTEDDYDYEYDYDFVKVNFVLPVPAGTTLRNATVKMGDNAPIAIGGDNKELKAKVYNVKRRISTLADAWIKDATVTVYFYHQYSTVGEPDYCTFYNTGFDGEDMFEWDFNSYWGYVGGNFNLPRQLILDEDNDNILIFKQNWGEGYVGDIDDNWEENGFQVTFNKETNTYTQWYGPGVKTIVDDQWYNPSYPPSFVRLEVNGWDVTSTLTEDPLE